MQKKETENDLPELKNLSNPHSKGDDFPTLKEIEIQDKKIKAKIRIKTIKSILNEQNIHIKSKTS